MGDPKQQSAVREALKAIIRNDKTPPYEYGDERPDGTKPKGGQRWTTPAEIARCELINLDAALSDEQLEQQGDHSERVYVCLECGRTEPESNLGNGYCQRGVHDPPRKRVQMVPAEQHKGEEG